MSERASRSQTPRGSPSRNLSLPNYLDLSDNFLQEQHREREKDLGERGIWQVCAQHETDMPELHRAMAGESSTSFKVASVSFPSY